MRKVIVTQPETPIGDDLKESNEKIIGGAWLFANRSAERIDFNFGQFEKEEAEPTKNNEENNIMK